MAEVHPVPDIARSALGFTLGPASGGLIRAGSTLLRQAINQGMMCPTRRHYPRSGSDGGISHGTGGITRRKHTRHGRVLHGVHSNKSPRRTRCQLATQLYGQVAGQLCFGRYKQVMSKNVLRI